MKISQREARKLRKRVAELERQEDVRRSHWVNDYPEGIHIAGLALGVTHETFVAIKTARRLRHAVVAIERNGDVMFFALPIAKA